MAPTCCTHAGVFTCADIVMEKKTKIIGNNRFIARHSLATQSSYYAGLSILLCPEEFIQYFLVRLVLLIRFCYTESHSEPRRTTENLRGSPWFSVVHCGSLCNKKLLREQSHLANKRIPINKTAEAKPLARG